MIECRSCGERLRSINVCGLMTDDEERGLVGTACPRSGVRDDCPLTPSQQEEAQTRRVTATPLVNSWWPSDTRVEIATTRTQGGRVLSTTQLTLEV